MASTFSKLIAHIVFSTKHRETQLPDSVFSELAAYMGGHAKSLDVYLYGLGGYRDHVHILIGYRPSAALATIVGRLKATSSKWMKTRNGVSSQFCWQDGYSAFSVSQSMVNTVLMYVRNQREHHKHRSFREELVSYLKAHDLPYKEEYLLG